MKSHEDLILDEDGIPILRDVIHPQGGDGHPPAAPASAITVDTPSQGLTASETLRKALDELAAELSLNIYQHIDRAIRPVIEQAITRAIDEAGSNAYDEIRQQLESRIPDILARLLEEANPGDA